MLDQQHREPLVADGANQVDQRGLLAGIESGRRFVKAEQLGLGGQRAGNLEPTLIAIGQVLGLLLAAVGDADELQQCDGTINRFVLLAAVAG